MIPAGLKASPFAPNYYNGVDEFIDVNGFAAPLWISSPQEEYDAVRNRVGLLDSSMLYKFDVEGEGAVETVNAVVTRDLRGVDGSRVVYTAITDAEGRMVDDATIIVLAPDHVRVTGSNTRDADLLAAAAPDGVTVREVRDGIAHLCIQGPRGREVLAAMTDADVSNDAFPYYTWQSLEVAGIPAMVARLGFTAELGYEISVPAADGLALYEAAERAGADFEIAGFGGVALMMMRIEAGMVMGHGQDYDESITPFECGLGWAISTEKDFLGREALEALRDETRGRLVTVELDSAVEDADGAPVSIDGDAIGVLTSAIGSPMIGGRTLALARVDRDHTEPGTAVVVGVDGQEVGGTVRGTPFYDPDRLRVKA